MKGRNQPSNRFGKAKIRRRIIQTGYWLEKREKFLNALAGDPEAELQAAINQMTSWQNHQWMKAGGHKIENAKRKLAKVREFLKMQRPGTARNVEVLDAEGKHVGTGQLVAPEFDALPAPTR